MTRDGITAVTVKHDVEKENVKDSDGDWEKKKPDYQWLIRNSWRNGASKIKSIVKINVYILIDETESFYAQDTRKYQKVSSR